MNNKTLVTIAVLSWIGFAVALCAIALVMYLPVIQTETMPFAREHPELVYGNFGLSR